MLHQTFKLYFIKKYKLINKYVIRNDVFIYSMAKEDI